MHAAHDSPRATGRNDDGHVAAAHCDASDTQSLSLAHRLQPVTQLPVDLHQYAPQPKPADVHEVQLRPPIEGLNCDGHTAGGAGHNDGAPMQSACDAQYPQLFTQAPVERHIHTLHVPGPALAVQL